LIHLFLTLQVGKRLCRKAGLPLQVLPLQLLAVPAEITVAYMIVYTVGMFLINTDYGYALVIANVLVGYLFVLAGIGWVDSKMQKFPAALRTLIKTILLFAAFFRENLVVGIVYNLLMLPGLFISLSRRVIIHRNKGDDQ
ncbi:MAG: hypothetical protein IJN42_03520, partial [Clostridia bacterium]|nr:hypothetical protein [Clostridia bacterium]